MFERGLKIARAKEDRWNEFESLRALLQLELETVSVAKALARSAELLEVAAKMGDGSELAVARSLDALVRICRGDQAAECLLDEALAGLRGADVKGVLAYVLSLAAERDVENGRFDIAEQRAKEALRAAETVNRRSQAALARTLLARVALAQGNAPAARRHLDYLLQAAEQRPLSARAQAALSQLHGELGKQVVDEIPPFEGAAFALVRPLAEPRNHPHVAFDLVVTHEPMSFVKSHRRVIDFDGQRHARVSELARARRERVEQIPADALVAFGTRHRDGHARGHFVDEAVPVVLRGEQPAPRRSQNDAGA